LKSVFIKILPIIPKMELGLINSILLSEMLCLCLFKIWHSDQFIISHALTRNMFTARYTTTGNQSIMRNFAPNTTKESFSSHSTRAESLICSEHSKISPGVNEKGS
jgi:hypothetical protein